MPAHSPPRILILDDERAIADTLAIVLNQRGYSARAVYNHDQAIAAARDFHPDVFITGVFNLCEKNGCETAAEVLSFLPDCRVLIFSGSGGPTVNLV